MFAIPFFKETAVLLEMLYLFITINYENKLQCIMLESLTMFWCLIEAYVG